MKTLQLIIVCGVILAASVTWQLASEAKIKGSTAYAPPLPNDAILAQTTQKQAFQDTDIDTLNIDDAQKQAWLEHPRVKAYFEKESQKQQLKDYFDNPSGHDPQAIYSLIEKIEAEGRMVAFEALSLKLAWLEKNTTDADEFKTKSEAIINQYKQKAQQMNAQYKPENIPGFTQYKAQEKQIIDEVNNMSSFPDGHSKQSYLRERLLQARIVAYGE